MTFKVGDKVRYNGDCATFSGTLGGHQPAEGVVTDVGNRIGTTRVELTSRVERYPAGSVVSLFTRNLELITHEHKVGDWVTVKGWETGEFHEPTWEGRTGKVYDADSQDAVCVEFFDGKGAPLYIKGGFEAKYLIPAEEPVKPFTFADIQVGDKIRRTETWDTGSVRVFEGVVTDLNDVRAYTKEHLLVGYYQDGDDRHTVLELLERPEPPKVPELWEDREPGDKLVSYFKNDGNVERIFTKRDDGQWDTIVMSTAGKLQKGFARSDHELAAHLNKYGNKVHLIKA